MKILLIMDPGIPVPPPLYGGHERLVYSFAEEYTRAGHDVTLLAGPDSFCSGTTITFGKNDLNRSTFQKGKEIIFTWNFLRKKGSEFDIIHNFGRLIYLLPVLNNASKKLMTYGRRVTRSGIKIITAFPNKNLVFTACSNYCVNTGNVAGEWRTIYNAIDFSLYQLNENVADDAPLMFLGRLDKIKGVHTAIRVAKATNNKLVIGGNIPTTSDNYQYFKNEIEPLIDNQQIIYLGALNDTEKNTWLQQAKAFLFPVEWDEPFGMVMVEAMACGTPVIAFNRGSVPEVIDPKYTGMVVDTVDEMIAKLPDLYHINRAACRQHAFNRFNVKLIANRYLNLANEVN